MRDLLDFMDSCAVAPRLDCHAHDPDTSREAADRLIASGRKDRHCGIVLALVKRLPGYTAVELWNAAYADDQAELGEMQEVRRRLVDLERSGLVRKGQARPCRVRTTNQVTWLLA